MLATYGLKFTSREKWACRSSLDLYVPQAEHLILHKGLTTHLLSLHPELGKMTNGFQKGDEWAAYVENLIKGGSSAPESLRNKVLEEFGSYYITRPLVPASMGAESPMLKFSMDAMNVKYGVK